MSSTVGLLSLPTHHSCQWSAVAPCCKAQPLHSPSQELPGTDAYPDKTCRQQLIGAGGRLTQPCCKLLPDLILLCPSNSMHRKRREAKLGGPQLSWLLAPFRNIPKKMQPSTYDKPVHAQHESAAAVDLLYLGPAVQETSCCNTQHS